ncbi:MAG: hypothetical protein IKN48_09575 [Bacteroidaceae bacterium]|nr:hypothetical protein [Bacteroidaceae bacterium]
MENYNDFEDMRQQIGLLKSKLGSQRIVNEDIIRHVVQQKMHQVNRIGWGIVAIGLLEIPLVLWVFRSLCGFSWLFCIVTALYVLATVLFQLKLNMAVQRQIRPDADLLAVGQRLVQLKRLNIKQLYVAMPFSVLWTCYFLWEAYQKQHIGPLSFEVIAYIVLFGVAMGLVVGLTTFFRRYNAMRDAISQLDVFLPQTSQRWQSHLTDAIDAIQDQGK